MTGIWYGTKGREAESRILPPRLSEGPATGVGENFAAAWRATGAAGMTVSGPAALRDAYDPVIAALNEGWRERGARPLPNPYGVSAADPAFGSEARLRRGTDTIVGQVWDEIARRRAADPTALPGLPDSRETLERQVEAATRETVEQAQAVMGRATGAGTVAGFAGGMARAMTDPPNLLTLPIGAPASWGILRTAVAEGLINAGIEGASAPAIARWRNQIGLGYSAEELLQNMAFAAGGGALLGGGIKAAPRVLGPVVGAVNAGRRQLLERFARDVPRPDARQRAAAQMARREIEVDETLPAADPAPAVRGDHRQRFEEALAAAGDGRLAPMPDRPAAEPRLDAGAVDNLEGIWYAFDPRELEVDARTFQFKGGGDAAGVTDRLAGIGQWDPVKAGAVVVYQFRDGSRFIADGHQRLALARRILDEDPDADIKLMGFLLREEDGVTPGNAREIAAIKNIAEGTGTAVDAAKVLRVSPQRVAELPLSSGLVRTARDLVKLDDEAFMMVVNEIVPEHFAALVGRLAERKPELHGQILGLLARAEPDNLTQAESIVRQALEAGAATERQVGLFGEEDVAVSLFAERARVLDRAMKKLRRDRAVFQTLTRESGRIEEAGNVLAADVNQQRAMSNAEALQTLQRLAHRRGPLSDALNAAAAAERERAGAGVDRFVDWLRAAARDGTLARLGDGAGRRGGEAAPQVRAGAGADAGELEGLEAFADPGGKGQEDQAAAIAAELNRLSEDLAAGRAAVEISDETFQHPGTGEGIVAALMRAQAMPPTRAIDTPARRRLRKRIAGELYGSGAARQDRIVDLVLGPPAAGKSTLSAPLVERRGALLVDSDLAKERLPEFEGGIGAHAVHEESDDIVAKMVLPRAVERGDNIVWPLVGKTREGVEQKIAYFKAKGYSVRVHLVEIPTEKTVDRVLARFASEGRLVDPRYVAGVGSLPRESFDHIKGEGGVDGFSHIDNDVPQGQPPRLLEAGGSEAGDGSRGVRGPGVPRDARGAGAGAGGQAAAEGPRGQVSPQAERDALAGEFIGRDDDFWGIETQADTGDALFKRSGLHAAQCTGYACEIRGKLGADRVEVFGFEADNNPSSAVSQIADGHDFAVVDGRFIVDPWVTDLENISPRGVFDLRDPADVAEIERIYGDRQAWERAVFEGDSIARFETAAPPAGAGDLAAPVGVRVDEDGNPVAETRSAAALMEDHAADESFLDSLETICGGGA